MSKKQEQKTNEEMIKILANAAKNSENRPKRVGNTSLYLQKRAV